MQAFHGKASTGGRANAIATGLQIQSSLYGATIPVWYGRARGAGKLIWSGNFQSQSGGNKKGVTAKGRLTTYSANASFLLGYAPIQGVASVYFGKNYYVAGYNTQTFTAVGPATSFSFTINNIPAPWNAGNVVELVTGVTVQRAFSVSYSDYGDAQGTRSFSGNTNLPLYNGNYPAPNNGSWANAGIAYAQYNVPADSPTVTVVFPTAQSNISVTVYYEYSFSKTPSLDAITASGLIFEQRLGFYAPIGNPVHYYTDFSGFGGINIYMGVVNLMQDYSLECAGLYGYAPQGDANPADVIIDMICSGNWQQTPQGVWNHGLGLTSFQPAVGVGNNANLFYTRFAGILNDEPNLWGGGAAPGSGSNLGLNTLRNYCQAYGIYVSQVVETQMKAGQILDTLCQIANCAPAYDGLGLSFIPYCEVSNYGNGASYVAPTSTGPLFTLNDIHFKVDRAEPPVTYTRKRPSDNYNSLTVEYTDRNANPGGGVVTGTVAGMYTSAHVVLTDTADVTAQGPQSGATVSLKWLMDGTTATNVGWAIMRRHLLIEPKQYKFKLKAQWSLLSLMDLILIVDSALPVPVAAGGGTTVLSGTTGIPVRITRIAENEDFSLEVEAEPFYYGASVPLPPGIGTAISGGGGTGGQNQDPGAVNTPIIFEPVPKLFNQTQATIAFSLSGSNQFYGGCQVWMSTDGGSTYVSQGQQVGKSTNGLVYNSTFPSHADPDATNTAFVDLTQSVTTLGSFTTAQRDAFQSVCYFAGGGTVVSNGLTLTIPYELVGYATATLQAANKYSLPPTTRRSVFNTPTASHAIGTAFAFLMDNEIFLIKLDPNLIGTTLFFKFTAFNVFGQNEQALSAATAYSFTPTGQVGWNTTYSISPQPSLYQGKPGGWAGVDANSATWTDPTKVYFPPITANFPSGSIQYAARDSGLAVFTSTAGGQTGYVTVFDPGQVGEPSGAITLSAFADLTAATHYNQPGYTRIGTIVSQPYTGGGGGGGGTGGGSVPGPYDSTVYFPAAQTSAGPSFEHLRVRVGHILTYPGNFAGSYGDAKVAATASTAFTIQQGGVTVGTATYAAGALVPTFTTVSSSGFVLNPGDEFTVIGPAVPDVTLSGFSFTLVSQRS